MRSPADRLDGIGTTVFAEMTTLALQTDSVNLGQGFPDIDGPSEVIEKAVNALRSGRNQYPPGTGVPDLREAIARHQKRLYDLDVDPNGEVAVTTGATEALAASMLGLVNPGDEVIVLEPFFDTYVAMLQVVGAVRRPVTLRAPDFRLPIDELRAAVTPRTTAILLNTPHNPTGAVLTRDELTAVAEVAIEHDLIVISDEVYEHLTFGVDHIPIATLPGMAERTLTISSGGKSFSFTGWKIGWGTGPADLVGAMVSAKQFLSYASGAPLQPAIAAALDHAEMITGELRRHLHARRDQLCHGLAELGFEVYVPDGTYFATTDIRPLGFEDGLEFCRSLPERCGVATIPEQVLHDDQEAGRPLVRWAFCKQEGVIDEALDRLSTLR